MPKYVIKVKNDYILQVGLFSEFTVLKCIAKTYNSIEEDEADKAKLLTHPWRIFDKEDIKIEKF